MATRSRTVLFLQYRQSFSRTTRRRPLQAINLNNMLGQTGPGDEKAGLLGKSEVRSSTYNDTVIEMTSISPRWSELVAEVEGIMKRMKEKMGQLEQLHKKHLLPGFEEKYSDERQIDLLVEDITKLMTGAQKKIKQFESSILQSLQAAAAAVLPISNENESQLQPVPTEPVLLNAAQQKMVKNVQMSLAQKLHDLGTQFRREQNLYLQKLRGRETQTLGFIAPQSLATSTERSGGAMSSSLQQSGVAVEGELEDYDIDTGFTSQQNAKIINNEAVIAEREKAITNIAKSINQIALIFQDLNAMIIDQGTILDRIDYNMDMVVNSLKDGVVELKKGEEYQKSSRAKYIVFILLILVFVCVILLIYRKSSSSSS